jgi:hypothetical protein
MLNSLIVTIFESPLRLSGVGCCFLVETSRVLMFLSRRVYPTLFFLSPLMLFVFLNMDVAGFRAAL